MIRVVGHKEAGRWARQVDMTQVARLVLAGHNARVAVEGRVVCHGERLNGKSRDGPRQAHSDQIANCTVRGFQLHALPATVPD